MKNKYIMDVNLCNACNFKCSYCFEHKQEDDVVMSREVLNKVIDASKIICKDNYLALNMWGGEPLLQKDKMFYLIDKLLEFENIEFMIFTNGYYLLDNKERFIEYKNKLKNRFIIQVSYDFLNFDKSKRINKTVNSFENDQKILETIQWLDDNNFQYSVKTTGTWDDLENNLYEQYMNFVKVSERCKNTNIGLGYTPDTSCNEKINYEKIGNQLKKLLVYFKKNNIQHTGFSWFDSDNMKLDCSGGVNSFAVNTNGNIVLCHGCLYGKNSKMVITSVFDENFLFRIDHNFMKQNLLNTRNKQCEDCKTLICYRCNANNCNGNINDWNKSNNENVCDLYKYISKYIAAYKKMKN